LNFLLNWLYWPLSSVSMQKGSINFFEKPKFSFSIFPSEIVIDLYFNGKQDGYLWWSLLYFFLFVQQGPESAFFLFVFCRFFFFFFFRKMEIILNKESINLLCRISWDYGNFPSRNWGWNGSYWCWSFGLLISAFDVNYPVMVFYSYWGKFAVAGKKSFIEFRPFFPPRRKHKNFSGFGSKISLKSRFITSNYRIL
jgi:hypothetical protein